MRNVLLISVVLGLAACASAGPATIARPARTPWPARGTLDAAVVHLAAASGSLVSGSIRLEPVPRGVHLQGEIGGVAAGSVHGFHLHAIGDCSAADAASAGGHFNPTRSAHGRAGSAMHHAGDIDNLVADAAGVAHVEAVIADVVLGGGGPNDILGRALVVHAAPDDYRSQPAGNAGARIACGVVQAAAAGMPRATGG